MNIEINGQKRVRDNSRVINKNVKDEAWDKQLKAQKEVGDLSQFMKVPSEVKDSNGGVVVSNLHKSILDFVDEAKNPKEVEPVNRPKIPIIGFLLSSSKYKDHKELLEKINETGDLNQKDSEGRTILDIAIANGDKRTISDLEKIIPKATEKTKASFVAEEEGFEIRTSFEDFPDSEEEVVISEEPQRKFSTVTPQQEIADSKDIAIINSLLKNSEYAIHKELLSKINETGNFDEKNSQGKTIFAIAKENHDVKILADLRRAKGEMLHSALEKAQEQIEEPKAAKPETINNSELTKINTKLAELSGETPNINIDEAITELSNKKERCYEEFPASIAIASNIDARDAYGNTALMHAAKNGDLNLAKILINAGADINANNKAGVTVLMQAAKASNKELFNILLTKKGSSNVDKFISSEINKLVTLKADGKLLEKAYANALLDESAKRGLADNVGKLINIGADVNQVDISGNTTLMKAAASGNKQAVDILVEAGANLRATNSDQSTASEIAKNKGHVNLAKALKPSLVNFAKAKSNQMGLANGINKIFTLLNPRAQKKVA